MHALMDVAMVTALVAVCWKFPGEVLEVLLCVGVLLYASAHYGAKVLQ